MTFKIDNGSGEQIVTVGPMAIVAWEQENRTKVSRLVEDGIGVSDMTDLVYRQLKLEGKPLGTLDEWRASLLDIDPEATPAPL
jgi:hypothetical protein